MSFSLELGYSFLDFRFGVGISDRIHRLAGYRGLYSISSAGYAGLKIGLYQNKQRTVGVSLIALGGYGDIFQSGRDGTLVTAFFELGWEMRIMKFASYYLAMGVEMFANSHALPAMV